MIGVCKDCGRTFDGTEEDTSGPEVQCPHCFKLHRELLDLRASVAAIQKDANAELERRRAVEKKLAEAQEGLLLVARP